jgi:hypothetical protein
LRSESRRLAGILACAALATGACALEKVTIPVQKSALLIHAVLSSSATSQTVLVERTLTGEVTLYPYVPPSGNAPVGSFSGGEQVVSDWGNPESGAVVEITTPTGQMVVGQEYKTFTPLGNGAGMYRVQIPGTLLIPGGRYTLRVRTTRGEVATAETVVPAIGASGTPSPAPFDRTGAPLALTWPRAGTARGYEVRVDGPYGAWLAISEGTQVALDGLLRNTATNNLVHVFLPGFRQNVSVSAVDANLYEYYRTVNSGFTGSGIVNRMNGAIGVFGSYATIVRRTVDVTAPHLFPVEGTYDLVAQPNGSKYGGTINAEVLTIYVESPSAKSGQADALTGRATRSTGTFFSTATGTKLRDTVRMVFPLIAQSVADTADWFKGVLRGDTLDVRFSKGAPAWYVKRRP